MQFFVGKSLCARDLKMSIISAAILHWKEEVLAAKYARHFGEGLPYFFAQWKPIILTVTSKRSTKAFPSIVFGSLLNNSCDQCDQISFKSKCLGLEISGSI